MLNLKNISSLQKLQKSLSSNWKKSDETSNKHNASNRG